MNAISRQSPRSRQGEVLDIVYRLGEASVADIQRALRRDVSYSAVRSVLRALEEKGLVRHRERGLRYVYAPVVTKARAARAALAHLLRTYFEDEPERVLVALLDIARDGRREVDYSAMKRLVEHARKEAAGGSRRLATRARRT